MPGALGLRVAVLAAGLVAAAVIAAVAGWSPLTIVIVMAAAFVVASTIEVGATLREREDRAREEPAAKTHDDLAERVRVFELEPADAPASTQVETPPAEREPYREPEPEPEREPQPAPEPEIQPQPEEPKPEEPKTEPMREAERPPLVAVPPPPPEPEPVPPSPERVEPPVVVSLAARDSRVREWNLWELERLARERAGDDPVRDEERNYLLMYMREFATPDGMLPSDFDALVRDSFGDLLAALPR